MARTYWLDLFTVETWNEFQQHGGDVSGFSEKRWPTVQKIKPGDYLLCYLTQVSRWVGLLEVTGEPFFDHEPIWTSQIYPSRLPVRVVLALVPEFGVPVLSMRDELTAFQNLDNPNRWHGPFRGSPNRWKAADAEAIIRALEDAHANPVERPLGRLGKHVAPDDRRESATGIVIVPEDADAADQAETTTASHTEIQYLLVKLGTEMGFQCHIATNDQGRIWNEHRLADLPRRREHLPLQFDPATNRTIELIDVLWLDGNAIVAAFEVESTTSIYSGLLRMSDLLACQPNISVPLFLVAPEERRSQVIRR